MWANKVLEKSHPNKLFQNKENFCQKAQKADACVLAQMAGLLLVLRMELLKFLIKSLHSNRFT